MEVSKLKKLCTIIYTFLLILTCTSCKENKQNAFIHDNGPCNNNVKVKDDIKDPDMDDKNENKKENSSKEISNLPDVGVKLKYSGRYICIGADEDEETYKYCLSLYYEGQDVLNMFLIEINNSAKDIKMRGFKGVDLFDTGYEYIKFKKQ